MLSSIILGAIVSLVVAVLAGILCARSVPRRPRVNDDPGPVEVGDVPPAPPVD